MVYTVGQHPCAMTLVKIVIGALIVVFALFELVPSWEKRIQFNRKHLALGGALSGFFGGLSGHQGALRAAVLIHCGLSKEAFIATGVVCAGAVDCARLLTYGLTYFSRHVDQVIASGTLGLAGAATLAAFSGAYCGARLMKKVTMKMVQRIVGVMLMLVAVALGAGLI